MRIDLKKMQNKVDKLVAVFTNIVDELNTQIGELNDGIDENNEKILTAEAQNKQYADKIGEYEHLRNKIESIVK